MVPVVFTITRGGACSSGSSSCVYLQLHEEVCVQFQAFFSFPKLHLAYSFEFVWLDVFFVFYLIP